MKLIRSLFFNVFYITWTLLLSFIGCLLTPFPRRYASLNARFWGKSTLWVLGWMVGLKYQVRGRENLPPGSRYIIASKHQSAFETIADHAIFPNPAYILKKELLRIPLFGWNLLITGSIPIDRSSGTKAMRSILDGAKKRLDEGQCVIIFPEGTRTAPGATARYNPGVALLYEQCGVPIIPVVLNSGEFWKKNAFIKEPGLITVDILPAMPEGLSKREFLEQLQDRIETAYKELPR